MELKVPVRIVNNNKAKLTLLNCFLKNLTNSELEIVAAMLDMNLLELTSDNRSVLKNTLKMSTYNFNNYIKKLADKSIISFPKDSKVLTLNPRVKEFTIDNKITVEFQPYE